jgi:hypothetical protein
VEIADLLMTVVPGVRDAMIIVKDLHITIIRNAEEERREKFSRWAAYPGPELIDAHHRSISVANLG